LLIYQNLLVLNRAAVVRSFISLYRALGGGWQVPVPEIAARTPRLGDEALEAIPVPAPVAPAGAPPIAPPAAPPVAPLRIP
jgi:hypothetical protein